MCSEDFYLFPPSWVERTAGETRPAGVIGGVPKPCSGLSSLAAWESPVQMGLFLVCSVRLPQTCCAGARRFQPSFPRLKSGLDMKRGTPEQAVQFCHPAASLRKGLACFAYLFFSWWNGIFKYCEQNKRWRKFDSQNWPMKLRSSDLLMVLFNVTFMI